MAEMYANQRHILGVVLLILGDLSLIVMREAVVADFNGLVDNRSEREEKVRRREKQKRGANKEFTYGRGRVLGCH